MFIRVSKNKENPYIMVDKHFVNDERLSWKAKGVLLYLLSKPDDWKVYEADIIKHATDGRDAVRTAIKELINAGYIIREKTRDDKGRIIGSNYVVFEVPSMDGFSVNGKSVDGKSDTTNNNINNNNITNYNNDNGALPNGKGTHHINPDIVKAIQLYMSDLYVQKTGKAHPFLKPEQYQRIYETLNNFCEENCLEYHDLVTLMIKFLNSNISSDWNINHFATDGILLNRFYEKLY